MGLLKFYYDDILSNEFFRSIDMDFLLNNWNPDEHSIEETEYYKVVSNEIMKKFNNIRI